MFRLAYFAVIIAADWLIVRKGWFYSFCYSKYSKACPTWKGFHQTLLHKNSVNMALFSSLSP